MSRTRTRRKTTSQKRSDSRSQPGIGDSPFFDVSRDELHELYRHMCRTRAIEERLAVLYRQGKLYGSLFRSLGQEATAVGAAFALKEGDVLCNMIRDLGALLVRGYTARDVFAQYMCRQDSACRGRDGIHHLGSVQRGVISTVSMMGAVIPVVAGAAWALQKQGRDAIGLTFVGDGGTSTGEFHEGLNLAAVLNMPLVLVIEHNGWAYSLPTSKQTRVRDLAVKAQAYGVPATIVDGNDPVEVLRATRLAAAHARSGKGPYVIEAKTYRMKGHAEHDDQRYVNPKELQRWGARDPVRTFREKLRRYKMLTDREEQAILEDVQREVAEGEKEALALPLPNGKSVAEGVFDDDSINRFVPWWVIH